MDGAHLERADPTTDGITQNYSWSHNASWFTKQKLKIGANVWDNKHWNCLKAFCGLNEFAGCL